MAFLKTHVETLNALCFLVESRENQDKSVLPNCREFPAIIQDFVCLEKLHLKGSLRLTNQNLSLILKSCPINHLELGKLFFFHVNFYFLHILPIL